MAGYHPVELERAGVDLMIVWSDGLRQRISVRALRDVCQCASCMEKHSHVTAEAIAAPGALPVLSPAQTMPLEVVAMKPVGNYGYNIQFSDGHVTGIYTLDVLRRIGTAT
jgi:DUF971 family protein